MQHNDSVVEHSQLKDGWSIKERRDILRELIIHEDNLTISRSQSLYTIQGFLFASLGLLSKDSHLPSWSLRSIIILVGIVGICSAVTYFVELKKNTHAIGTIIREWHLLSKDIPNAPPIIGYLNKSPISQEIKYESPFRLPRGIMPIAFIIVWISVSVITFFVPL
jgi:hypothetical protein